MKRITSNQVNMIMYESLGCLLQVVQLGKNMLTIDVFVRRKL